MSLHGLGVPRRPPTDTRLVPLGARDVLLDLLRGAQATADVNSTLEDILFSLAFAACAAAYRSNGCC